MAIRPPSPDFINVYSSTRNIQQEEQEEGRREAADLTME